MWIYVLGEVSGGTIKIGHSTKPTVGERINEVRADQHTDDDYVLLAAVRSSRTGEDLTHRFFDEYRQQRGRRKEYYNATEPLIEWVLWLRQQWFVSFDENERQEDAYETHPDDWVPKAGRREQRPTADPSKMVQDFTQLTGPLAGTAWDFLPDLTLSFQDYFTDPKIVAAARTAMGGLDLDAASHWLANRRLHKHGVDVGEYFHVNKSAFEHDWLPRTWLNPPYGQNDLWFSRALKMMDEGKTEQLCMLSPIYVFTTRIAQDIMRRAQAAILFSPTPEFLNPGDPNKTGTNLPHCVVYWGDRREQFLGAYQGWGIPFSIEYSDIAAVAA